MQISNSVLQAALQTAAAAQLGVAILNLGLEQIMGWQAEMERMPLLIREVHRVHAWFISVTLAIFGVVTWRFAGELAAGANPMGRWLAFGIGCFWGLRTVLQVTYYSSAHWRGQTGRTVIHVILLAMYGGIAAAYLLSATR